MEDVGVAPHAFNRRLYLPERCESSKKKAVKRRYSEEQESY